MPKYKKKQTHQMNYEEFKEGIQDVSIARQAFLTILFFAGCRVSEALALTSDDINCTQDMIYIQFFRKKGSNQTDPTPLPKADALLWVCGQEGKLFTFSYRTAHRMVQKAFPAHYPHYFRMNRIVKISEKYGDHYVYSFIGICAQSIDHYRGKVDIKRVGQALSEELK